MENQGPGARLAVGRGWGWSQRSAGSEMSGGGGSRQQLSVVTHCGAERLETHVPSARRAPSLLRAGGFYRTWESTAGGGVQLAAGSAKTQLAIPT